SHDHLHLLLDIPRFAESASDESERNGFRSKIQEVVLHKKRPVWEEHPFCSPTNCPTGARHVGSIKGQTIDVECYVVIADPGRDPFSIKKPVWLYCESKPTGN